MRINIYNEELTSDIEVSTKVAEGKTYYGIRFYLHSAEQLHKEPDDDRSAVTFWTTTPERLIALFSKAVETVKAYRST
jgi:hypothetical protein